MNHIIKKIGAGGLHNCIGQLHSEWQPSQKTSFCNGKEQKPIFFGAPGAARRRHKQPQQASSAAASFPKAGSPMGSRAAAQLHINVHTRGTGIAA